MSKPTTGQHYVWRSYLAAWTKTNSSDGQIVCLRDKKPFPVSLAKVAKENCFYGVKELSQQERELIYEMTVRNTNPLRQKAAQTNGEHAIILPMQEQNYTLRPALKIPLPSFRSAIYNTG